MVVVVVVVPVCWTPLRSYETTSTVGATPTLAGNDGSVPSWGVITCGLSAVALGGGISIFFMPAHATHTGGSGWMSGG